jgi:hypothetical protein
MQSQFGGPAVVRTCRDSIPFGTDFFFPIFNFERDRHADHTDELQVGEPFYICVAPAATTPKGTALPSMLELTIDNIAVPDLFSYAFMPSGPEDKFVVDASCFTEIIKTVPNAHPAGFNFPLAPTLYLISGGYHVLVQNLREGLHSIRFKLIPNGPSGLCGIGPSDTPLIDIEYKFNIAKDV